MNLTGSDRILQVHPTRRCNLSCLHCYSDSSPRASDTLDIEVVRRVVADAAGMGYTVLSVSGGEPFLYKPLVPLLEFAKDLGLRTQVVTNGLLITPERLTALHDCLDLLAVSIDGAPEDHDRMRGRVGAFSSLENHLACARDSGIPFGLLFTLTMFNVHQLEWAVDLSTRLGANFLQVHPLEASGRASALADEVPDEIEASMALLEAGRLRERSNGRLKVHVDIGTNGQLRDLARLQQTASSANLSDRISPLVVEPDGMCVPLEYGFPREFAFGDIRETALVDLAREWIPRHGEFFERVRDQLADLDDSIADEIFVNCYQVFRDAMALA